MGIQVIQNNLCCTPFTLEMPYVLIPLCSIDIDGLVVFKGKDKFQYIRYWLGGFQQILDKA